MGRLTSPLREAEIERITVKQDGNEQSAIEKSEEEYFEQPESLELESDSSPMEGQREAFLIVSKLSFVEGTTWSFIEKGATLVAKIEDENVWEKVHQYKFRFGEGNRLRVLLHWRVIQAKRSRKLIPKNIILKVYEVVEHPVQMRIE